MTTKTKKTIDMVRVHKFALGRIVATPGALDLFSEHGVPAFELLDRHQAGDWGEVGADDWALNDQAIESGDRILSSYSVGSAKIWIITEYDRSATTLLLPSEY